MFTELVKIENDQVVTTSLIIAEKFEREHKDVLDSIRQILVAENSAAKFFFEYIDETYEYPVIYISPKGMRYVLKALINAGYKPQITAEEWERKCQLDQEEEEE